MKRCMLKKMQPKAKKEITQSNLLDIVKLSLPKISFQKDMGVIDF